MWYHSGTRFYSHSRVGPPTLGFLEFCFLIYGYHSFEGICCDILKWECYQPSVPEYHPHFHTFKRINFEKKVLKTAGLVSFSNTTNLYIYIYIYIREALLIQSFLFTCLSKIFGACVVTAGIAVVLSPMVASNGSFTFGWSAALIVSCVPLVLR